MIFPPSRRGETGIYRNTTIQSRCPLTGTLKVMLNYTYVHLHFYQLKYRCENQACSKAKGNVDKHGLNDESFFLVLQSCTMFPEFLVFIILKTPTFYR